VEVVDILALRNKRMMILESSQVCWIECRGQDVDFKRTFLFEKILCVNVTLRPLSDGQKRERDMKLSKKRDRKWVIDCCRGKNDERSTSFAIFCTTEMKGTDSILRV
jgi:hypothetical protein